MNDPELIRGSVENSTHRMRRLAAVIGGIAAGAGGYELVVDLSHLPIGGLAVGALAASITYNLIRP